MNAATASPLHVSDKPILIVDDNPDVRDSLSTLLEMAGYATVTADNGMSALTQLREGMAPCMILLDYHMPVMDGVTFRQRQVADPALAAIPVVLYSGAYDIRAQAKSLNVPHVFQKPLDPKVLVDLVRRYC